MVEHPKKAILFDSHMEKKKKHGTESRLYVVIRSDKVISGYEGFFFRFFPFYGDFNIHRQAMEIFISHTQNYTTRFGFSNWFTKPKCVQGVRGETHFFYSIECVIRSE